MYSVPFFVFLYVIFLLGMGTGLFFSGVFIPVVYYNYSILNMFLGFGGCGVF